MALFEMDWREVPRFDSKGNRLDPEKFKEDIISKYGATYFAQNFSCVKGNTKIVLKDTLNNRDIEIPIEEAYNNIRRSNFNRFKVLTQSGFSEFSGVRRTEANKTLKIFFDDSFIEVSEDHKFMVFGKEVIAKTLREGDVLQTRFVNKNVIITKIETSEEKCFVYDVLETQDHS